LGQVGPGFNSTNYDLIEKISAAYVMNTLDLTNRIRLVAGVRFEQTSLDTAVPTFDANNTFQGLALSSGSYLKVLPSASLRFKLDNDTDLRVVYSRGLGVPTNGHRPVRLLCETLPVALPHHITEQPKP